jgi:hypothetical protein
MRRSTVVPLFSCLVPLAVLGAAPAQAAPPTEHEHYSDELDELLPTAEDIANGMETFCGLVDVSLTGHVEGVVSRQIRGNSEFPYFSDRFRGTFVYTNPETGLTFTIVTVANNKDLHVVDNGDGTLTITGQTAGRQSVYGPDGELLFTDRGLIRDTFLVDTKGTVDPEDDEFIDFLVDTKLAGPHDTFERDFCADFLEFTAG